MSSTSARRPRTAAVWTGWVVFGGIMMVLLGLFHAVEGLVAVFDADYYLVDPSGMVVGASYATWGWLYFGLGVVVVAVGCGVLAGNRVAQIAGAVLAGLSALVHLAFVPAYPVWSLIIIVLDVVVIYALVAHGRETAAAG